MKTGFIFLSLFLLASPHFTIGQSNFDIQLDTFSISGLPGIHSFAVARHEGKWLLIGGRRDGMHQKFNSFATSGGNQQIIVVDPESGEVWQRPLAELPDTLAEQLRSTNMEFFQQENLLCFVGGYGRSEVAQNHITYPYLTLIDVGGLVNSVVDGSPLPPHFQQVRDTFFAVTGAQLQVLSDTFFLVGGHRFEGVYSANSGDNQLQFYTNSIRKFTLESTGQGWQVAHKSIVLDELNLHRRDYNLAPQIFQNGERGLVAFAGVFQPGPAALPFQNIVEIGHTGHTPVNGFSQFLVNYHCAKVPVFDAVENEMHTLFFGGMSQYYLNETDSLIRDNRVPFVKTVSRVSRLADGSYTEVPFQTELPYYTGTSAEFVLAAGVPVLENDMIDYEALPDGNNLIGYIVGGIVTPSNQRNPFIANNVGITTANNRVIRVSLIKNMPNATAEPSLDGQFNLGVHVFPNPANEAWKVSLNLPEAGWVRFILQNAEGKIVRQTNLGQQPAGPVQHQIQVGDLLPGTYWLTVNLNGIFMETKTILSH
ncbi:MAG: hypothetical protein HUU45_01815 [Leptospiraceae bacterium]|nr:hypothetical protein [Leptospiraceae bacterium]